MMAYCVGEICSGSTRTPLIGHSWSFEIEPSNQPTKVQKEERKALSSYYRQMRIPRK